MTFTTIIYSRKQRCVDCEPGDNCNVLPKPKLYTTSKSTSLFSSITSSKHIFSSEQSHSMLGNIKGIGNVKKHGSGGNSYHNYLSKKKGIVNCNCNISK
jgi:hypothetical protein